MTAYYPTRQATARMRGSAMVELVVMLFPYAICMIGLVILGHLAMGRQESQKMSILAAPLPGDQDADLSFQEDFFFPGWNLVSTSSAQDDYLTSQTNGVLQFREDPNYVPDATRASDEPVLPYGNGADDISAGFTRLAYEARTNTTVTGGVPTTTTETVTTGTGNFLISYEIMSATGVAGREPDIETLLGDWLDFSEARATYGFAYGGGTVPMESNTSEAQAFRNRYTLHRRKPALNRDEPDEVEEGYAYYSATRNDAFWYGTAQQPGPWAVYSLFSGSYAYAPDLISADEDFDRLETVSGVQITPSVLRGAHVLDNDLLETLSSITFSPEE